MNRLSLLLAVLFLSMTSVSAQMLRQHIWKERVLLIFAPDFTDNDFEQQLANMMALDGEEVRERRIVTYRITPGQTLQPSGDFMRSAQSQLLYDQYGVREQDFKVILIGLDGRIKLRKRRPVTGAYLLKKIDQMPMRRSELSDY